MTDNLIIATFKKEEELLSRLLLYLLIRHPGKVIAYLDSLRLLSFAHPQTSNRAKSTWGPLLSARAAKIGSLTGC